MTANILYLNSCQCLNIKCLMQNKSNTTDMQVKHFVKTIPDTLGFQADLTSSFEMLQAKMNLKFLWLKLITCNMHWKLASTFTPGRKIKYTLGNWKDPLLCFLSFWNICLTVFKKTTEYLQSLVYKPHSQHTDSSSF